MIRRLLPLVLLLSSCMSIPLSTIVRMSGFDEKDFAKLDPDVVKVRIALPAPLDLDPDKSTLGVKVNSTAGVHYAEFNLTQVTRNSVGLPGGLFYSAAAGTQYVLRLAAASKPKFRELQDFVSKGSVGEIDLAVNPALAPIPDSVTSAKAWIDLLFTDAEGFIPMLDGAALPLDDMRRGMARKPG